jgi:hyperosmotically inducible periplasmic protein
MMMNVRGDRLLSSALIAVAVALGVGGCAQYPDRTARSPTAGERFDDSAITARVKTALAADAGARTAANVNVETYDGVVQLSGFVESDDMADRAVDVAKGVRGVRSVKNDIRIRPRS